MVLKTLFPTGSSPVARCRKLLSHSRPTCTGRSHQGSGYMASLLWSSEQHTHKHMHTHQSKRCPNLLLRWPDQKQEAWCWVGLVTEGIAMLNRNKAFVDFRTREENILLNISHLQHRHELMWSAVPACSSDGTTHASLSLRSICTIQWNIVGTRPVYWNPESAETWRRFSIVSCLSVVWPLCSCKSWKD